MINLFKLKLETVEKFLFTCLSFFFLSFTDISLFITISSNKAASGSWEPVALWYSNSPVVIWWQNDGGGSVVSLSVPAYFIWRYSKKKRIAMFSEKHLHKLA